MPEDLFRDIPADLVKNIKQIWEEDVRGGGARFQASGDRSGQQGQRKISTLLKKNGVMPDTDGRWEAVIEHGRGLYKETPDGAAPPRRAKPKPRKARKPKRKAAMTKKMEGRIYTPGSSFRARAEERQRLYRGRTLGAKPGRWGHLLDDDSRDAGRTFLDPRALEAAQARMEDGKGVVYRRTFGNMLSSQALCFNLFGPLASDDDGRAIAAAALSAYLPDLESVESIDIEYTPSAKVFRDQRGPAGVDCDVLLTYRTSGGGEGVLVIETKYTETGFSRCAHCKPDREVPCPRDVEIGDDFSGCMYSSKNKFLYWQRASEYGTLDMSSFPAQGCPFRGSAWQLWVNHTLAHAVGAETGAEQARFAVCAPAGNSALLRSGARLAAFQQLLTSPDSALFIPLEELVERIKEAAADQGEAWVDWAKALDERYVLEIVDDTPPPPPPEPEPEPVFTPVKSGHHRIVEWMDSDPYREIVAAHDEAIGPGRIYFRPTERGVVRIALHDDARGYVGFRTKAGDLGYLLSPSTPIPTVAELRDRWAAFEQWLPTVRRVSLEEQGVIPWLRRALSEQLTLPDLGKGWLFLHNEWRFLDGDGDALKSDLLAVHLPTGRLGIVDFKSAPDQLDAARIQVQAYAACWNRDRAQLAPLFTNLLHAMGQAYGNPEAAGAKVTTHAPAMFVGVAAGERGIIELESCR